MRRLGAVEIAPGADVAADDEKLKGYVRGAITLLIMHPCCTAAMMPRDKGGVVGVNLKVHGAAGLRVVDMSVMPLVPGTHPSAAAYAVGEKASFDFRVLVFRGGRDGEEVRWCYSVWCSEKGLAAVADAGHCTKIFSSYRDQLAFLGPQYVGLVEVHVRRITQDLPKRPLRPSP